MRKVLNYENLSPVATTAPQERVPSSVDVPLTEQTISSVQTGKKNHTVENKVFLDILSLFCNLRCRSPEETLCRVALCEDEEGDWQEWKRMHNFS